MEITIRTELPNLTDTHVQYWYYAGIPFWEMLAIAIEAFRQPNANTFFSKTLSVVTVSDNAEEIKNQSDLIWSLLEPWLVQLYRKCSQFNTGTVSRVEMGDDDRSLNIQLYLENI